jgi:hypothetical protein
VILHKSHRACQHSKHSSTYFHEFGPDEHWQQNQIYRFSFGAFGIGSRHCREISARMHSDEIRSSYFLLDAITVIGYSDPPSWPSLQYRIQSHSVLSDSCWRLGALFRILDWFLWLRGSHTESSYIIPGQHVIFSALQYLQSERIWRRGAAWSSLGSRGLSRERLGSFLQTSYTRLHVWAQIQIVKRVIKSVATYLIATMLVATRSSFNVKQLGEFISYTRTWC